MSKTPYEIRIIIYSHKLGTCLLLFVRQIARKHVCISDFFFSRWFSARFAREKHRENRPRTAEAREEIDFARAHTCCSHTCCAHTLVRPTIPFPIFGALSTARPVNASHSVSSRHVSHAINFACFETRKRRTEEINLIE